MEQIHLAYCPPKETVSAIMMLHKNTKIKVTDYFDILAGVLEGDILAPYLFIICLDYVLKTSIDFMKANGFKLANTRSSICFAQTISDADYADDISLLAIHTSRPNPSNIVW